MNYWIWFIPEQFLSQWYCYSKLCHLILLLPYHLIFIFHRHLCHPWQIIVYLRWQWCFAILLRYLLQGLFYCLQREIDRLATQVIFTHHPAMLRQTTDHFALYALCRGVNECMRQMLHLNFPHKEFHQALLLLC